jgi:hypothetical protein
MPYRVTPAAQHAGREVVRARAAVKAADLAPIVKALQESGITSRNGVAASAPAGEELGTGHAAVYRALGKAPCWAA